MRASTHATLESAFDPHRNSLTAIRLGLAAVVAVCHTLQLSAGWQPTIGGTELGDLAVDAFFVISGYLVTGSLLRLRSVRRYGWHRFLRIMPGFWVCLLVTALLVAPALAALSGRPALGVFSAEPSAIEYLRANALLLMRQFDIGGFGAAVPGGGVVDGSMWTLVYEAACYAIVAVLGAVGLLARRPVVVLGLTVAVQLAVVLQTVGVVVVPQERMLRLALMFLLGCTALLYAGRLPLTRPLAIAAAATAVAAIALLPDYRAVGAVGFAYLVLLLATRPPLPWQPRADLSYGLYVYHWPIASLLVTAAAGAVPVPLIVALDLVVALAVALLSWRFVEAPALRLKSAAWVTAWPRRREPGPRRPRAQALPVRQAK